MHVAANNLYKAGRIAEYEVAKGDLFTFLNKDSEKRRKNASPILTLDLKHGNPEAWEPSGMGNLKHGKPQAWGHGRQAWQGLATDLRANLQLPRRRQRHRGKKEERVPSFNS